jgi:hypothetical protein
MKLFGAIWNCWIIVTIHVCDGCRIFTGSTEITLMAAKGVWIKAGLLMC